MLSFSSGEVIADLVGVGGWQGGDLGMKRVRTAPVNHLSSYIKGQILGLHPDICKNRNRNEDGVRLWTPSYSKAKLNASLAHPSLLHKRSHSQNFQYHVPSPVFASDLPIAQMKILDAPHALCSIVRTLLFGNEFEACIRKVTII